MAEGRIRVRLSASGSFPNRFVSPDEGQGWPLSPPPNTPPPATPTRQNGEGNPRDGNPRPVPVAINVVPRYPLFSKAGGGPGTAKRRGGRRRAAATCAGTKVPPGSILSIFTELGGGTHGHPRVGCPMLRGPEVGASPTSREVLSPSLMWGWVWV